MRSRFVKPICKRALKSFGDKSNEVPASPLNLLCAGKGFLKNAIRYEASPSDVDQQEAGTRCPTADGAPLRDLNLQGSANTR